MTSTTPRVNIKTEKHGHKYIKSRWLIGTNTSQAAHRNTKALMMDRARNAMG